MMDKNTIGHTRAAIKLIKFLEEEHPNGGSRQRKILRAFTEYSKVIKDITDSNIDSRQKKNLLRLAYEDRKRYFQGIPDGPNIQTHCLNVAQAKYGDAVIRVEFGESINLKQLNFDYLINIMKKYMNIK